MIVPLHFSVMFPSSLLDNEGAKFKGTMLKSTTQWKLQFQVNISTTFFLFFKSPFVRSTMKVHIQGWDRFVQF